MSTSQIISIGTAIVAIAWGLIGGYEGWISWTFAAPIVLNGLAVLNIHPNLPTTNTIQQ